MAQGLGMHRANAVALIMRGSVYIDGHCVQIKWAEGHWTEGQLHGRMLKVGQREMRLYGSRLLADFEQMSL